jgi:hypothetical protein
LTLSHTEPPACPDSSKLARGRNASNGLREFCFEK